MKRIILTAVACMSLCGGAFGDGLTITNAVPHKIAAAGGDVTVSSSTGAVSITPATGAAVNVVGASSPVYIPSILDLSTDVTGTLSGAGHISIRNNGSTIQASISGAAYTTLGGTVLTNSASLRSALSDELGTGVALFDGATPTSFVLTNATGLPASSITGTTLPSGIVTSSLTSLGTLTGLNIASSTTSGLAVTLQNTAATNYTQLGFQGTGRTFQIGVGNASESAFGVANKFFLYDGTLSAISLVVDAGKVGIGTVSPATTLDVAGTVTATGFAGSGASLTGLTAANITASTTVGRALLNATNPSAITFPKVAADNSVSFRTPAQVLSDIGAQASGSYVTQGADSTLTAITGLTGAITSQVATAATSGANQHSGLLTIGGTYWTGSASANDTWSLQNVLTTGTNPVSHLTFTPLGSTGNHSVQFNSPYTKSSGQTNQDVFTVSSNDASTSALQFVFQLNMSAKSALMQAVEQGSGYRDLFLQNNGGGLGIFTASSPGAGNLGLNGNLRFTADNTNDIGASSSTFRPRDGHFGRNVDVGGTHTVTGASTLTGGIVGKIDASNATAGNVGEYVSASVVQGSATALTTATAKTVTSISLTAGDWDITGIGCSTGASTGTNFTVAIGTTTNSLTGTVLGDTQCQTPTVSLTGADATLMIPAVRASISSTTVYFLVAQETFTVGTPASYGRISARRVR